MPWMIFPGALEMYFSPCIPRRATNSDFFFFSIFLCGATIDENTTGFHYTLHPTSTHCTHTYKPLSWKNLRELVSIYYEGNRTAILCRSMLFFLCIATQNRSNVDFRQMRRNALKPPRTRNNILCFKIGARNGCRRSWPA